MIRALLIVNPVAGRGAGARAAETVVRAFRRQGWTVELVRSAEPGHAVALAAAAVDAGMQRVVAVGGDGTVHEVANGLLAAGSDAALGVVPVGSGNDFAKLVGLWGLSPDHAVARVAAARPRRLDVGRVFGEYFVNSVGFGFGPAVVRARNAMPRLPGAWSYLVPIVRTFFGYQAPGFEIRCEEHTERGNMMMIEVCNGTTAGGAYRVAPAADPADGRLDVCLVRQVSLPRFLFAIRRVRRGTHGAMKEVALFQTTRLLVRSPAHPLRAHLDGELRVTALHECTVTVEPAKLLVLAC